MRIYVAGPYTLGDTVRNGKTRCQKAEVLLGMGHVPYVPHLTAFWHLVFPHAVDFWYAYDLEWLAVCDALYRLPGESVGADNEMKRARTLGLPVYERIQDIPHLE